MSCDNQVINATVETEDGLQIPVKVLDCDSVSQAKEKMLDAVYKVEQINQSDYSTHMSFLECSSHPETTSDIY